MNKKKNSSHRIDFTISGAYSLIPTLHISFNILHVIVTISKIQPSNVLMKSEKLTKSKQYYKINSITRACPIAYGHRI